MSTNRLPNSVPHDSPQPVAAPTVARLNLWPGAIIAMLGIQITLMLIMVYIATSDRSFAVEPNYYDKALHWDDTVAQRQANRKLDWAVNFVVSESADMYKQRDVTCSVSDKAGNPISDAQVDAIAFAHARGNERNILTLPSTGNGQYATRTRISRAGLWEFRIVVTRGTQTFTQAQQLHVAPAGARR